MTVLRVVLTEGGETCAYFVSVHTVPGADGTTRVDACTCAGVKFHELLLCVEEVKNDMEAGLETIGRCKHGDTVADRTADDREAGQHGFEAFSNMKTNNDNPNTVLREDQPESRMK